MILERKDAKSSKLCKVKIIFYPQNVELIVKLLVQIDTLSPYNVLKERGLGDLDK